MFKHFFFPENRDVYEITWKNTAEADRPYVTIEGCVEKMPFGCGITKARIQKGKGKNKVPPCTGTEALYSPYGPEGE